MFRTLFAAALLLSASPALAWQDPYAQQLRQQQEQEIYRQFQQDQYDRRARQMEEAHRRSMESLRSKPCYTVGCYN